MFEKTTGSVPPWVEVNSHGSVARRYGLCPECDGAMLLVNIARSDPKQLPHGRHLLRPVSGFDYNLKRILQCNLFNPAGVSGAETMNFPLTEDACRLRDALVHNFNLAVGLLQEDIAIGLGRPTLQKMVTAFLWEHWYCWPTVSQANVPWLFARTGQAFNLYGQALRPNAPVTRAVLRAEPNARLGRYNRLESQPGKRFHLYFGMRNHIRHADGKEDVDFYVQRKSSESAQTSELVFEKTIPLRLSAFAERSIEVPTPSGRAAELNATAQRVLSEYLTRFPQARLETLLAKVRGVS